MEFVQGLITVLNALIPFIDAVGKMLVPVGVMVTGVGVIVLGMGQRTQTKILAAQSADIKEVKVHTNGMTERLEEIARQEGRIKGHQEGLDAGVPIGVQKAIDQNQAVAVATAQPAVSHASGNPDVVEVVSAAALERLKEVAVPPAPPAPAKVNNPDVVEVVSAAALDHIKHPVAGAVADDVVEVVSATALQRLKSPRKPARKK